MNSQDEFERDATPTETFALATLGKKSTQMLWIYHALCCARKRKAEEIMRKRIILRRIMEDIFISLNSSHGVGKMMAENFYLAVSVVSKNTRMELIAGSFKSRYNNLN